MNPVKLITIFAENRPGGLARVTKILAEANVNVRWVTIATSGDFGVMKFLVDQCDLAYLMLKQCSLMVSLVEVIAVEVEDSPGGLHGVANCLASHSINIENASGFEIHGRAVLLIEVKDAAHARQLLEAEAFRLLSQEEILDL
jgi:hypothetical protein